MITLSEYLDTPSMGALLEEKRALAKKIETKRRYEGARINRLESGWTTNPTGGNYEMRLGLRALRARAREMARNNSHFKKFLTMVRSNVIGPNGIQLQSRARIADGSLNTELNKRVEEAFWEWSFKENCTASGKLDFLGCQNLFVMQLARDGEVLIKKISGADNPFGFALKFIDVSYLDENYNEELTSGNRVIMSVEVDRNDKPVAYYLTTPASEYIFKGRERLIRVRVPATEIIHAFLTYDDETQTRGVTWFHTALIDAKHLQGYKRGVITSAEVAAYNFGMLIKKDGGENDYGGEDDEGNAKDIEMDVSPLSMNIISEDYDFKQFDPKQPTQNHSEFYKSMSMDLAVGLDVNYFNLMGDMESVNYSSARVGLNEERDNWRGLQAFVITHFCREVFHEWARSAWLAGKLKLAAKEFKEIKNPMWRARGWSYIDPQKEIRSKAEALDNNLTTYTDEYAEQGKDFAEVLETIKSEREQAAKMGVDLRTAEKAAADKPGEEPDEDENEKSKTRK